MQKSVIIALTITAAIVLWLAVGMIGRESVEPAYQLPEPEEQHFLVEIELQQAQPIRENLVAHGDVEADRLVTIAAEVSGSVLSISKHEGQSVQKGELLVTIDQNDKKQLLAQAQASLNEASRAYDAEVSLRKDGYSSDSAVDQKLAQFKAAEAALERQRLLLEKTKISAPFSGILFNQRIEEGSFLGIGTPVISIVDNDPLTVTTQISQFKVHDIVKGRQVEVEFATGQIRQGIVSFVSPVANVTTRTFEVEIEVDNPDALPSGMSAEVRIPLPPQMTHFLPTSLLSLNDKGHIGVKTVDDQNKVVFHEVEIISASNNGVYVTGLPEVARIITNGQGFVSSGESVRTVGKEQVLDDTPSTSSGS